MTNWQKLKEWLTARDWMGHYREWRVAQGLDPTPEQSAMLWRMERAGEEVCGGAYLDAPPKEG